MDQITAVERELLVLGVPASIPAEQLRRLAKDLLWEALEMKSAEALTGPVASIEDMFEIEHDAALCDRVAAAIWESAHAEGSKGKAL